VVIGTGRCWNSGCLFSGDPNLGSWIAVDLGVQQAADLLALYDCGRLEATPWAEAERRLSGLQGGLLGSLRSIRMTTVRSRTGTCAGTAWTTPRP
jgi:hypothetical protein